VNPENKGAGKRLFSLDLFRGFCLVGMIIFHAMSWYRLTNIDRKDLGYHIGEFWRFALAGFIMLVGLMVGFHYLPKLTTPAAVRKTVKRLFWRAGQIFMIAYVFTISFYLLFRDPGKSGSGATDPFRSWDGLFEVAIMKRANHRMSVLILIAALMILSIAVVLLRKYFRHWSVALAAAVGCYTVYLLLVNRFDLSAVDFPQLLVRRIFGHPFPVIGWGFIYFVGLAMGILIHRAMVKDNLRKIARTLILIGVTGFVCWVVWAVVWYIYDGHYEFPVRYLPPAMPYYVIHGMSLSVLFVGIMLTFEDRLRNIRSLRWMLLLGRHGLFTFVFQWCAVHFCFHILKRIDAPLSLRWIMVPVTIAIVYVAVVLESRWLSYRKSLKRLAVGKPAGS
jgi:hypothetical protein